MSKNVLDPESFVGEVDSGDNPIVVTPDVKHNVIRLHPVCRAKGLLEFGKISELAA